jgi:hypothetical protein
MKIPIAGVHEDGGADRQTDRHEKPISRFSQFRQRAYNALLKHYVTMWSHGSLCESHNCLAVRKLLITITSYMPLLQQQLQRNTEVSFNKYI